MNGTYSANLAFFCMVSDGENRAPCTWRITKGPDWPLVQILYLPVAYFPLQPDDLRWMIVVGDSERQFATDIEHFAALSCVFSDIEGKYVLFGTNELPGMGDCAGQTIEITIS